MTNVPMEDMGRGILAPPDNRNIETGAKELRTLSVTAAAAFSTIKDEILTQVNDRNYVAGEQVRNIITSPNPYIFTQPGDLLLVTDTPKWFTDFHDTPIGEAPVGMTDRWGSDYSYQVVSSDTALGGKLLRFNADRGNVRLLTVPEPTDLVDPTACEMVIKWRATTPESVPRALFWGGGSRTVDENGVHSIYRSVGQLSSGWMVNGGTGTNEGSALNFTPGRWYITRARIAFNSSEGSPMFNVRMWNAENPEREAWGHRTTNRLDDMTQSGWAGIYFRGPGQADIDWIGVSWDQGRAPKPEVQ